MSTIAIDGTDYPTDSLSDEARSELISMQACDQKIEFSFAISAHGLLRLSTATMGSHNGWPQWVAM